MDAHSARADLAPGTPRGDRFPAEAFFVVSATFHYLGPSFAVLLFARLDPLGVAWLRNLTAAVVFVLIRRSWRDIDLLRDPIVQVWGLVLGAMNCFFYLAIDSLPLGTVAAIEFVPVVLLAAWGLRTRRNMVALTFAVLGVGILTHGSMNIDPRGLLYAAANAVLFGWYIVLGHRAARHGVSQGIDSLAAAMVLAAILVTPIGMAASGRTAADLLVVAAGIGVGVTSSVIPYVIDQLVMARLPRSTYALLTAILPAAATVVGLLVLRQRPTLATLAGIALVVFAVALRRDDQAR